MTESKIVVEQLKKNKEEGNEAFRRQDWLAALRIYSQGINCGIDNGVIDKMGDRTDDTDVVLLATLYSNRAASGLKLGLFEQVVHDCDQSIRLILMKGSSEAKLSLIPTNKALYGKARSRRGAAFRSLGNLSEAMLDFGKAFKALGGAAGQEDIRALARARGPEMYTHGRALMRKFCQTRSSSAIENVEATSLTCRLPSASGFMSAVTWNGRIWCYGGQDCRNPLGDPCSQLYAVDPKLQKVFMKTAKADPQSKSKYGLSGTPNARIRHSAVVWKGSMYIYGGKMASSMGCESLSREERHEGRTIWKLELKDEGSLQWERIYCKHKAPGFRRDHTAVVWRDCMIVYGGSWVHNTPDDEYGDVWSFDFVTCRWSQLQGAPPPRKIGRDPKSPESRAEHAAWVAGDWMYIWGGASTGVPKEARTPGPQFIAFPFTQMWRLSLTENRWELVHTRGNPPTCRSEMGYTTSNHGALLIAGGYSTAVQVLLHDEPNPLMSMASYFADVFMYCPVNNYWRAVRGSDLHGRLGAGRAGCSAAWLDGKLYVLGGYASYHHVQGFREVNVMTLKCCAHCGAQKGSSGKLYQCEKCNAEGRVPVYYCSKDCLAQDWPLHKILCSKKGILP